MLRLLALLLGLTALAACSGSGSGRSESAQNHGYQSNANLGAIIGSQSDNYSGTLSVSKKPLAKLSEAKLLENKKLLNDLRDLGKSNLTIQEVSTGVLLILPKSFFEGETSQLSVGAKGQLADIAQIFRKYSQRRIAISGHTDALATMGVNQKLSEARARVIAAELVKQGLSRGRLSARGFGEQQPVASNANAAGREANQRVEVVVEHTFSR